MSFFAKFFCKHVILFSGPVILTILHVFPPCLQSTHMASQHINEEAVYLCTGNPMPKDIEQIAYWLLNESFKSAFNCILPDSLEIFAYISFARWYKILGSLMLCYLIRYIWCQNEERTGLGGYCEGGYNVWNQRKCFLYYAHLLSY